MQDTQKIIAIISNKEVPLSFKKSLSTQLTKISDEYLCLPFKIEKKYLKNIIECMKIMDIEALVILDDLQKEIGKYITPSKENAKSPKINIVKREKNIFIGRYFAEEKDWYKVIVQFITGGFCE